MRQQAVGGHCIGNTSSPRKARRGDRQRGPRTPGPSGASPLAEHRVNLQRPPRRAGDSRPTSARGRVLPGTGLLGLGQHGLDDAPRLRAEGPRGLRRRGCADAQAVVVRCRRGLLVGAPREPGQPLALGSLAEAVGAGKVHHGSHGAGTDGRGWGILGRPGPIRFVPNRVDHGALAGGQVLSGLRPKLCLVLCLPILKLPVVKESHFLDGEGAVPLCVQRVEERVHVPFKAIDPARAAELPIRDLVVPAHVEDAEG
mmetsp:Transcript_43032/g.136771  ORF Transcript_43032/g.136771 Transcript_43032/m.136771 type:complete len:256 (+) Transcript_43032:61-828(+)